MKCLFLTKRLYETCTDGRRTLKGEAGFTQPLLSRTCLKRVWIPLPLSISRRPRGVRARMLHVFSDEAGIMFIALHFPPSVRPSVCLGPRKGMACSSEISLGRVRKRERKRGASHHAIDLVAHANSAQTDGACIRKTRCLQH